MAAVIQAAASNPIRLLDLVEAGQEAGFFEDYPFYTKLTIPGGTYSGVDGDVMSFQDSALWVAGRHVAPELVKASVADVFSPDGLAYMVKVKSTAKAMSVAKGLEGIVTPVHPGAAEFWMAQGLTLAPAQTDQ